MKKHSIKEISKNENINIMILTSGVNSINAKIYKICAIRKLEIPAYSLEFRGFTSSISPHHEKIIASVIAKERSFDFRI
jgi:hypothetical protein